MSRYTYAGDFKNPTENWFVKDCAGSHYEVWIRHDRKEDGSAEPDRPHTKGLKFDTPEEANEWIENTREFFEQDYDEYLEENSYELAQMERYEQFKNEY